MIEIQSGKDLLMMMTTWKDSINICIQMEISSVGRMTCPINKKEKGSNASMLPDARNVEPAQRIIQNSLIFEDNAGIIPANSSITAWCAGLVVVFPRL